MQDRENPGCQECVQRDQNMVAEHRVSHPREKLVPNGIGEGARGSPHPGDNPRLPTETGDNSHHDGQHEQTPTWPHRNDPAPGGSMGRTRTPASGRAPARTHAGADPPSDQRRRKSQGTSNANGCRQRSERCTRHAPERINIRDSPPDDRSKIGRTTRRSGMASAALARLRRLCRPPPGIAVYDRRKPEQRKTLQQWARPHNRDRTRRISQGTTRVRSRETSQANANRH